MRLHRTAYGHGRKLAGIRRGAPVAPKRKRSNAPHDRQALVRRGLGFEAFLAVADREHFFLPGILRTGEERDVDLAVPEGLALSSSRREGFLLSTILHLIIVIIAIVKPDLLGLAEREPEERQAEDRLVLVVEPPPPAEPLTLPPLPPPPQPPAQPQQPDSDRMRIPKATQPAPPDKQQDFQTDLPFSEGNTEEFYTEKKLEEPGQEGEEGERPDEAEKQLADLLPKDNFLFGQLRPDPEPLQTEPPGGSGRSGLNGEGGPFEDIRRFMEGMQFHNPEGGLVTGKDDTLYYDAKGADFVKWIRRMLSDVQRNWLVPYTASYQLGHVAVAVSVARNGDIYALEVMIPSGKPGFDNAAVGALRASDLLPLPSDYPDDRFDFILIFWYNERPYDLF